MDMIAATEFLALNLDGKTGSVGSATSSSAAIAGWLAGKIVKGRGQGILMNIVIGVVGALSVPA